MQGVIQQLIFQANGRARVIFRQRNKIFYSTVSPRSQPEFKRKVKGTKFFLGYYVTAIGRFLSLRPQNGHKPIGNFPSKRRKSILVGADPTVRGLAIKKQTPPTAGLVGAEVIDDGID